MEELEKELKLLEECSELEGSEIGEVWAWLVNGWSRRDYLSKPFVASLKKEIKTSAKYLKENAVIKEELIKEERFCKTIEFKDR